MVRVPERKYLQTLMAGRLSSSLFVDELERCRIPLPAQADILELRDELIASNPAYFANPEEEADPDWITQMGLAPLFYYRFQKPTDGSLKGCEGAFRMLEDPRMTKYMHLLAFSGMSLEDIELLLNSKYNISFETDDFTIFHKFFANYDDWKFLDKELYVDSIQDPDTKSLFHKAIKGERAQLIWELGLGADPGLSMDDLLRDMFTDSYFYFKKNVKRFPEDAQKFAGLAVKISDRLESMQGKKDKAEDLITSLKIDLKTRSTVDSAQKIVNLADMHLEVPKPTSESIADLTTLMEEDVRAVKPLETMNE